MTEDGYARANTELTRLIRYHMGRQSERSVIPTANPDIDDKYIATHRDAADRLRKMRTQLEDIEAMKDYLEP